MGRDSVRRPSAPLRSQLRDEPSETPSQITAFANDLANPRVQLRRWLGVNQRPQRRNHRLRPSKHRGRRESAPLASHIPPSGPAGHQSEARWSPPGSRILEHRACADAAICRRVNASFARSAGRGLDEVTAIHHGSTSRLGCVPNDECREHCLVPASGPGERQVTERVPYTRNYPRISLASRHRRWRRREKVERRHNHWIAPSNQRLSPLGPVSEYERKDS